MKQYFEQCAVVALTSHDPDTKLGAVIVNNNGIVVSQGSNRFEREEDITPERLRILAQEGVLPKSGRDRYPVFECNVAYIRYLRERVQTKDDDSVSETNAAKLAKRRAALLSASIGLPIRCRHRYFHHITLPKSERLPRNA